MTNPQIDRPTPIRDAASAVQKGLGMLGAIATAAAGYGIITAVQGDAVTGLLGAIPGVVTLVSNLLVAFGIVNKAEPQVTPLASPRDSQGNALVASGVQRSTP
jgi:hypothetical protein